MVSKKLLVGGVIVVVLMLALALAVISPLLGGNGKKAPSSGEQFINVTEFGKGRDAAYAVFSHGDNASVRMLTYSSRPQTDIYISEEPGVGMDRFDEFVSKVKGLQDYGFNVEVFSGRAPEGPGIIIIPSGALPSYMIGELDERLKTQDIVYLGLPDLVSSGGIKPGGWSDKARTHRNFVMFGKTLDKMMEENFDFASFLLVSNWSGTSSCSAVFQKGPSTMTCPMPSDGYVRVVLQRHDGFTVRDSPLIVQFPAAISSPPAYPWEKPEVRISISSTKGTAFFSVENSSSEIFKDELSHVSEEEIFFRTLDPLPPGDYVTKVLDNNGTIGEEVLHVKDVRIAYTGESGVLQVFSVKVDGQPVKDGSALVSIGGQPQQFVISDGVLQVPAKLKKGTTVFTFQIYGGEMRVPVLYEHESIMDVYVAYGIPGLIIIVIVFVFALISRRSTYVLQFGEFDYIPRKRVPVGQTEAMDIFRLTRQDLGISGPLSSEEFAVGLRRRLTSGAEMLEGNLQSLLNEMVSRGLLSTHMNYYMPKGEGDIRQAVMNRLVKNKLMERGMQFSERGPVISTRDFDLLTKPSASALRAGSKRLYIVFEDRSAIRHFMASLPASEAPRIDLRVRNNLLALVTLADLDEIL